MTDTDARRGVTLTVSRQGWRLTPSGDGPHWRSFRATRIGADFRAFRCGDDGKPTAHRIGRSNLTLRLSHRTGRLMFDGESAFFDSAERKKIANALRIFD